MIESSTVYGNTAVQTTSTTAANIVANPSSSASIYKINSLTVANYSTNSYSITAELNVAGSNTYIIRGAVVPANASLSIIGKDTSIFLLENSSIQLTASQNSAIQAICSWEQIS